MSAGPPVGPPAGLLGKIAATLRGILGSRLARNSLTVFTLTGLGRAVALGKEVLVAALFGVSGLLDAYVLALLLPSFLANILGGSFSAVLVPALGKAAAGTQGAERARQLLGRALTAQVLLTGAAMLALAALPITALQALAPGATPERLALIKTMQLALLPLCAFSSLAHVLGASLNYQGDFKSPPLLAMLGALATILAIALLHLPLGVQALVAGANIGAGLECALLAWLARRSWGPVFRGLRWGSLRAETPALLRNWAVLALGASLLGLSPFIDNAIATTLGEGSVSALSYAWKLPSGLAGLLGLTLSTVLLPYFTGIVHGADAQELPALCRRMVKRLALLSAPLAVAGIAASPYLVSLLFQRGRFDAQAAELVSVIQACYFAQLPFYLLAIAAARMLQALSRLRFLLFLQAGLLAVNALTSLALSRVLGPAGIAVSSTIMYALCAAISLYAVLRQGRAAGPA
ncbi:murein biosynthesis integral membrane protein MurJ [Humidesulfovibrio sp.]